MTKPRILFVDNDPDFLDARAALLETEGHVVVKATTAKQARHALASTCFDLAILDVRLNDDADPRDKSGLELAGDSLLWRIPRIILTQHPTFEIERQSRGADGLKHFAIDKGEQLETVFTTVSELLALYKRFGSPIPPRDLVAACASGDCVLYAGSGLSAKIGLPTWKPFISGLLHWAVSESFVDAGSAATLLVALEKGKVNTVADNILSKIREHNRMNKLSEYLKHVFDTKGSQIPAAHATSSGIPFSAVLTTNFDGLLETTFHDRLDRVLTPHDVEELKERYGKGRFFLLKLYGDLDRPETLTVAPAEYESSVAENVLFADFMESLFFSKTLLFIGVSLDRIEAYLSGLKFRGPIQPARHYALVDTYGQPWQATADLLERRYGIQILPYTATRDYPEVKEFLDQFAEAVRIEQGRLQASKSREPMPRPAVKLHRLTVENIGPFDYQTVEFKKDWNLLLGDNGVGKSTILRAIAIAICGEAAKQWAELLIKAGRPSGKITLEFTSAAGNKQHLRPYVTTLLRLDLGAEVISTPTRPLHTERLVAFGFPPLRTMSSGRASESYSKGPNTPDVTDLLPLISGGIDPRLDNIGRWLLNLDHTIQQETNEGRTDTSSMRSRDEFYRIVDDLTPGMTVLPGKVDPKKECVTVITDDGEVPIEFLSQGASSLIGWAGTLVQRLFEVYDEEKKPSEQPALLLIDEIDAHMHPEWQQLLVPTLRRLFPSLQVIATTHSPLIVPSLEPDEIIRLRRNPKDRDIIVETPEYTVQGFRADQILTSPLFGLESTLTPIKLRQVRRYTALAAKGNLTDKEESELKRLAVKLNIKSPTSAERTESRLAYDMIQYCVNEQLRRLPLSKRKKIAEETRVQLLEIITGWRRP